MESEETMEQTELDELVSDNHLQMLKAAIPYISATQQQVLSLYVKALELSNTFQLIRKEESQTVGICSIDEQKKNTSEMLNAMKRYCTDTEREILDLFTNFMSAFHMYSAYNEQMSKEGKASSPDNTKSAVDTLKNLLSPEQKNMFDTYSTILSSIK